ncbi:MAG: hypothetical protein ACI38N_15480, partial [Glutamicibacter soli]
DDFETMDYLNASRKEYLRLARENSWTIIDGSRPLPEVVTALRSLAGYPASQSRDRTVPSAGRDSL